MAKEMERLSSSEKEKIEIIAQCTGKIKALERERDEIGEKIEQYRKDFFGFNEKVSKLEQQVISTPKSAYRVADGLISFNGVSRNKENMKKEIQDSSSIQDSQKKGPHPTDLATGNELPTGKLVMSEKGRSNQPIHPSEDITGVPKSAAVFVDLSESDDEKPIGRNANVLKGDRRSCLENEKAKSDCCENYPKGASKRKTSTSESESDIEDHMPISTLKRKQIHGLYHDREAVCSREPDTVSPSVAGKLVMSEKGRSSKLIHPSEDITGRPESSAVFVDLSESDDDKPIGRKTSVLKGGSRSCLENEKTTSDCCQNYPKGVSERKRNTSESESDIEDHMPLAWQKRKQIHGLYHDREHSFPAVCSRKPDSVSPNVADPVVYSKLNPKLIKHCEKVGKEQNAQLPLQKRILGGVDKSSLNSGCSRGHSYKDIQVCRETTWTCAADMLSAFKKDPELCMSAVCALYRQQISANKSTRSDSSFKQRGLNSQHAVNGSSLAKYLINNDPEEKLRRSVYEVRRVLPQMLDDCERFATQHYEQLFKIYQKKLDPYFGPRL